MGQQIFDSDGTFTVPIGVVNLSICMVGGGGSGAAHDDIGYCGGGYAGEVYSDDVPVTQEEVIPVTVGVGGISVANQDGLPGTSSSFGAITVAGGLGGLISLESVRLPYIGHGATVETCQGTFRDGYSDYADGLSPASGNGGQAGLGNGGSGRFSDDAPLGAVDGQTGSGGGGFSRTAFEDDKYSGSGGNGRVVVNWDDFVEDGGLLINGTLIPELAADGELHFYCKDQLGNDFDGAVQELMLDGQLVWKEI